MAKRQFAQFPFSDLYKIKQQVLNWSARFDTFSFLDNQQYASGQTGYECLAAAGSAASVQASSGNAFARLKEFSQKNADWLFGHFSFDLKAETEKSPSRLPDFIGFPDLYFFVPEIILLIHTGHLEIGLFGDHHRRIMDEIENAKAPEIKYSTKDSIVQSRITKAAYIAIIEKLREHILRGDCYEINFCQEFFVEHIDQDPLQLYKSLADISPSPFSAFYSTGKKYLLCASPERYLKKAGEKIWSQPIKGTAPRNLENPALDEALKKELADSEKDRSENVMVVDLVRNDLSRICETDSVHVSELFGIYSFPQVHQMISTIEGKPLPDLHWTDMIAHTFPMGSMTGAPKKRVLELTEQYESTKRGLFSGAVGYVKPDSDFDFNVVIRSMFYNQPDQYLAWFAGSGITFASDPEKEYAECLLKVSAFGNLIKNPSRVNGMGSNKQP